jgi:hypothetical protein
LGAEEVWREVEGGDGSGGGDVRTTRRKDTLVIVMDLGGCSVGIPVVNLNIL